jgi:transposase-like protein
VADRNKNRVEAEGMGKRFSEEFKREALKLIIEGGVPLTRVAAELNVGESTRGYLSCRGGWGLSESSP